MVTTSVRTIPIRHCNFEAKVKVGGSGPPLVYLHAAGGPIWDPFVEWLCESYTVYAPHHPGTGETVRESIYAVETLWDLVLIYDELFDALKLSSVPVIGTSFGGMMACELASHRPDRISLPAVQEALKMPDDPDAVATAIADLVWALGATGKFVWPIPDKGLKKRIHRVKADTLIVWGEDDALVSSVYAKEFAARIANSRFEIIKNCGHVPQVERLETLKPLVQKFLQPQRVAVTA